MYSRLLSPIRTPWVLKNCNQRQLAALKLYITCEYGMSLTLLPEVGRVNYLHNLVDDGRVGCGL